MAIIAKLPSFKEGLLVFTLLYGLYYIYWQLTVGASRRAVIKKHGCQPVRPNTEYNSFPNNALGFKAAFESIKAAKEHRYLETINSRFLRHGNTLKLRILMTDIITTIEPKNVQTMLALKFDDWKLPPRRKTIFETFGGRGIFTTDGPQWKHSRELVRPNFVRSQVGDLETFERHTRHLIAAIPKDGSTVDMQDLFFKLTTDSATEHLIGESTHSLVPSEGEEKFSQFAESFNRGVGVVAYTFRVSSLSQMYYLNGSQYKGDVKRCHDFVDSFVRKEFEKRKKRDLEKADAEEEGRYVFLKELVKLSDDPVEVRSELLNVLIAGRDTTASMLSDVWFVLARRPDIFVKLRAEVDELGGEKPTYQQLKDMKYLRYLMNECTSSRPTPCFRALEHDHTSNLLKHSASTLSSSGTPAVPSAIPCSLSAAVLRGNPRFSSRRASSSNSPCGPCTAVRTIMEKMRRNSSQKDGRN